MRYLSYLYSSNSSCDTSTESGDKKNRQQKDNSSTSSHSMRAAFNSNVRYSMWWIKSSSPILAVDTSPGNCSGFAGDLKCSVAC